MFWTMRHTDHTLLMTKCQKIIKTVFLVLVWVCLGLYLEITGPTLIDLKIKTGADYEEVAVAVSGRSVGYFIGSAIGGVLVDKWLHFCDLMIGVCLTGGGIATIFVPFSPTVELLWLIIVIQGTFEGIINIAGQKLILLLWEKDAASPLHILHGGFGIGSFIIPLIANPFLAIPRETHAGLNGTWNETLGRQSSMANNTNASLSATHARTFGNDTTTEYLRESRIEYAYLISAIITLALSAVFYGYHCRGYRFQKSPGAEHNETKMHKFTEHCKTMINPKTCTDGKLFYGIQMFSILFIYYFNIVGGERILGKFIRAYAIEQLDFSVSEGSYINTTFWISFAVGRISGFIAARYIPIRMLILIETGGVFVFSILLNIFAVDNTLALWILIQPLGLFHAPCFPSMMGWADFHMEMSGMAITFLLLGGSCGGVAYLKITGFLFETYGPRAFLYHILGYGIACISLAILLDVIGAQHGSRFVDMKKDIVSHEEDVEMMSISQQHDEQDYDDHSE